MFKTIPGFEKYEVNEIGDIKTHYNKNGKMTLKPYIDNDGYKRVRLYKDGKHIWLGVHKLVAITFLGGDHEGMMVNHIDYNRANNDVNNLEWVTPKQNAQHSIQNYIKANEPRMKPVIRIDNNGLETKYPSLTEAAFVNESSPGNIRRCLRGDTKRCAGFMWRYANE